MKEVILDTLKDTAKLAIFLFIAFLIIELIEHKLGEKSEQIIKKSGKFSPILGSLLGLIPQCGFSVMATNLYITRIISLGTLISIYLATSDEMLPILISEQVDYSIIAKILLIKFIIGTICGFIIDFLYQPKDHHIHDICEDENCHCEEEGILKSSLTHTIKTLIFIFVITFILNTILYYGGESLLSKLFLKNTFFSPFISSLIGLIPNCAASIMLTELYLSGGITFATMLAGLLTSSGVALLVLFRTNKNIKENLLILLIIYLIGVFTGLIINFF